MTETLVGIGLSNLLLSGVVGAIAYGVHRVGRYPALAHLLWALTLVVAVTPPLLMLSAPVLDPVETVALSAQAAVPSSVLASGIAAGSRLADNLLTLLVAVWIGGSLIVFAASAQRIVRFGRLLRRSCRPAPAGVQDMARIVAYELDMRDVPKVHVSAARLAPMTWWSGGRVRVVLPEALRYEVDDAQLRWILAHELAHIKRKDHMVRWLEWLALVAFWWNPVVWFARRNLRRDEEDACDALVLEHLNGPPRAYARTLLTVVELMAAPAAPTLATGIDAARSLEHRFTRIVSPASSHQAPRALAIGTVTAAMLLMTVGVSAHGAPAPAPDSIALAVPAAPAVGTSSVDTEVVPQPLPATEPIAAPELPTLETSTDTLLVSATIGEDGTYLGSSGPDNFSGTKADDSIKGYAGADIIGGGPGRDTIDGGEGGDTIRGGDGRDTLNGGPGRDIIGGGAGADIINGGAGADIIQGGAGRDIVAAGAGDDIVRVWADGSPDIVDCGGGDDRAIVGRSDTTTRCETVIVRDPS